MDLNLQDGGEPNKVSFTVVFVVSTVVVSPLTVRLPVTVRLSFTVVSDVE